MINEITRALNGMSDKVDLKAEKIELGVVEDMKKSSEQTKKLEGDLRASSKQMDDLTATRKKFEVEYEKLQKQIDKASESFFASEKKVDALAAKSNSLLDKAKRAANELGVNPTTIEGYKELEKDTANLFKARVGK